jgi:hypothetical protein
MFELPVQLRQSLLVFILLTLFRMLSCMLPDLQSTLRGLLAFCLPACSCGADLAAVAVALVVALWAGLLGWASSSAAYKQAQHLPLVQISRMSFLHAGEPA